MIAAFHSFLVPNISIWLKWTWEKVFNKRYEITFFIFTGCSTWFAVLLVFSDELWAHTETPKPLWSRISILKSDNLQYITLGRWDQRHNYQTSDVPSIIFFTISCKILCKNRFNLFFFFCKFTKIKIKSFECPKSIKNYGKKNMSRCICGFQNLV